MQIQMNATIDGETFACQIGGDFAWGDGDVLFDRRGDLLSPIVGDDGYTVVDLPPGYAESAAAAVADFLAQHDIPSLEKYHRFVDDDKHQKIISRSRNLRMADLGFDGDVFCRQLGALLGLRLSPRIKSLGGDHVQVRINRPASLDFNPPHRDAMPGYAVFSNTVNFWIPVAGCTPGSTLPLFPGGHLIPPSDCYMTQPGNSSIGGKKYAVPAIIKTRGGELNLIRPPVNFNQALVFTPYLIHGGAINQNPDTTRIALELRLTVSGQQYRES